MKPSIVVVDDEPVLARAGGDRPGDAAERNRLPAERGASRTCAGHPQDEIRAVGRGVHVVAGHAAAIVGAGP